MHPTIALRVDWSRSLGLGHLQRCLSLAEALSQQGASSVLIARRGPTTDAPRDAAVDVLWLPFPTCSVQAQASSNSGRRSDVPQWTQTDDARLSIESIRTLEVDAVVVDRYGLDTDWESHVSRGLGLPVVAIDGLADRRHSAELVIDPTYVEDDRTRWLGLVGTGTRVLRGPRYALISPRFQQQLVARPSRDGTVRRVLISFGGSDPQGLTQLALGAIEMLTDLGLAFDVVVGAGHEAPGQVRERCARLRNVDFHHATPRMAELMSAADLAVGSGGVTTYERAFLGLPALVVIAAGNQVTQVEEVARAGAVVALGTAASITASELAAALRHAVADPPASRRMSRAARAIVDFDTVPGSVRVAEEVAQLL